ncbi:MAG: FAD-dependent oxidoreductase [Bacteroidota bacterium]
MYDYLVVGLGLAGIAFCEELDAAGKSYLVISDTSQQASLVAGGLYNPVILKRFTLAWKADEQLRQAIPFYKSLEKKLGVTLDYPLPVYRRLASVEEQNLWYEAADKPILQSFLSASVVDNTNPHIDAPYGLGKVLHTGRIATQTLLTHYQDYLKQHQRLIVARFDHQHLQLQNNGVNYNGIQARKLVFAQGFGLNKNPWFNYLPLNGTKGELLTIEAPKLQEEGVIKSSVFLIPLGQHRYRVGATYKWKDKTNLPTEASRKELLDKLGTFLNCDFKVVNHVAGIRPTVADRRPLVGVHPKHKGLSIINGLGSRGVLIAPYAATQLFQHLEEGTPIDSEMDIQRFAKKWDQSLRTKVSS